MINLKAFFKRNIGMNTPSSFIFEASPNALNPSCSLPSEILASIFLIHRTLSHDGNLTALPLQHVLCVGHRRPVCNLWTAEFLRRSGQGVPLHVDLPDRLTRENRAMILQATTLARVRCLGLHVLDLGDSSAEVSLCQALVSSSQLPQLHELKIYGTAIQALQHDETQEKARLTLSKLISAPNLQTLTLRNIHFTIWTQIYIPSQITRLTIHCPFDQTIDVSDLLQVLHSVQRLEHLDVSSLGFQVSSSFSREIKLSLPMLISLNIVAKTSSLDRLLHSLVIPLNTFLRITITSFNGYDCSALRRIIGHAKTAMVGLGRTRRQIALSFDTRLDLLARSTKFDEELWDEGRDFLRYPLDNHPAECFLNLSLELIPGSLEDPLFEHLHGAIRNVQHVGMRVLQVEDFEVLRTMFMKWLEVVKGLETVETLHLGLKYAPPAILLDALHPVVDQTLPFPRLRSLQLRYMDFNRVIQHHEPRRYSRASAGFELLKPWDRGFHALIRVLQKLPQLVLHDCPVREFVVKAGHFDL
ncbi:hypothetical protein DL96DRAFT_1617965 [Flagelloscypha sp. PMI_526]|nr:hypothetical protein DL96DRAFT_1617965 [Flagelloscypha sp. PMI_526]